MPRSSPAPQAPAVRLRRRHRFYRSLLVLTVLVLVSLAIPFGISRLAGLGYFATTLLLLLELDGRNSHGGGPRREDLPYRLLGLAAMAAQFFWYFTPIAVRPSGLPLLLLLAIFVGWSQVRLLGFLSEEPRVNRCVLEGAVAGYLLLGITGGLLFTVLETVHPGSFMSIDSPEGLLRAGLDGQAAAKQVWDLDFVRMNYFAFVSLTTVGFGDVLPKTPLAQITTIGLSVLGPVYMAVLMGLLISRLTTQAGSDQRDDG